MCSPIIQLKDLRINNLNEEYENTDLLNKLSTHENMDKNMSNFKLNKIVDEKEISSSKHSLYETYSNTEETYKTRSETHSRQNFIPKDQLYKQSLNSMQTNSPTIPILNNFKYYESPVHSSKMPVNNVSPLFFNNNDANKMYQYPFNFNQTNNFFVKQQLIHLKLDLIFKSILVFLLIIDLLQIFILILHLLLTLTIISIIIIIIHLSFHVNQLRTIIKSILTITIMRMLISLNNINSFLIIRRKCKIRRIM